VRLHGLCPWSGEGPEGQAERSDWICQRNAGEKPLPVGEIKPFPRVAPTSPKARPLHRGIWGGGTRPSTAVRGNGDPHRWRRPSRLRRHRMRRRGKTKPRVRGNEGGVLLSFQFPLSLLSKILCGRFFRLSPEAKRRVKGRPQDWACGCTRPGSGRERRRRVQSRWFRETPFRPMVRKAATEASMAGMRIHGFPVVSATKATAASGVR